MDIIAHRRALHRIPEPDRQLPKTTEYVLDALKPFRCRVRQLEAGGICAFFDFGCGSAIAFRADMDALPIEENTGAEYRSTHPGLMHACGHDGHTAILLELARRLNERKSLHHNILLVFQPAEETVGGAKDICDSGIFRELNVRAVFGLHLWPGLEPGVIASRKNELMARSCEVTVEITGRSSHIAKSAEGIDALAGGVMFWQKATAMEKALPDHIFRLLKFGKMTSGSVRNAISDRTRLEGSLRAFQDEVFDGLRQGIIQAGREVEAVLGCTVNIHMNDGYPAILNPTELCDRVMEAAPYFELPEPSMTSEDFSWYQRYVPAMFFFLGIGDTPALHADNFDFDDSLLIKGADYFEGLAVNFHE